MDRYLSTISYVFPWYILFLSALSEESRAHRLVVFSVRDTGTPDGLMAIGQWKKI